MKRTNIATITLLFLLLAVAGTAKAQDYLPVVKDNAEWNIVWKATSQWTWLRITENLQLEGDTVVDDMHYKKVMRKISSEAPYWHGSTEEYSLYGLIREEPEGKVFYQPIDQDTVYLLYDFGMNVGDTASMHWCQLPNPSNEVIIRIDSINTQYIAGIERRVYYVSSKSMVPNAEWRWLNTWIEGIGATEGLLYSCHVTAAGGITLHELLCYHENGDLMYMNPNYDTCFVDTNNTPVEFAPVGAEWYYERYYREEFDITGITYDRFRSLRTIEINGWECKEIEFFQNLDCNGEVNPHTEYYYITQEGKQVFEVENGERYLLYDFGKKPGGWWYAPKYEDTIYVQAVSYMNFGVIDGFRKVFITAPTVHGNLYFTNIIEGIGMDYSVFPFETQGQPSCTNGSIRCYTENGIPLITSNVDCDYEVLTVDDNTESALATVKVMVNGLLHIDFSETLMGAKQIKIIDLMGRVIYISKTINNMLDIDFSGMPSGVYFVSVTDESGRQFIQKFVKQ
ncbi:MAG: T9SS type A sorting domain-containing protein [Bacteroidales bacterium]|nr:T9SS type A sorting domain-containing protein [Bacteroidales bacterium]